MFNKTENEIMKNWNDDISKPLVSIVCIVYNHEKFLSQAIESFLIQETDFPFELVVGEDRSTDNSLKVIQSYIRKYPNIIRIITSKNNVGMQKNFLRTMDVSQGKYIALCEGDDYWCDKDKLQKQFDYLNQNKECSLVHHDSKIVNEQGIVISESKNPNNRKYSKAEMICGNTYILTNTVMFRNINFNNFNKLFGNVLNVDIILWHYLGNYGNAVYMLGLNAAYRIHSGGIWSQLDEIKKLENTLKTRERFIKNVNGNLEYIKSIKASMETAYLEALQNSLSKFNLKTFFKIQKMILLDNNINIALILKFYFFVLPRVVLGRIKKTWNKIL